MYFLLRTKFKKKQMRSPRSLARQHEERSIPTVQKISDSEYAEMYERMHASLDKQRSPKRLTPQKQFQINKGTELQARRHLSVKLEDVNRPPKAVEIAIRGTYGLLLGNPHKNRRGKLFEAGKVIENENAPPPQQLDEPVEAPKKSSKFAMQLRKKALKKARLAKRKQQKKRRAAQLDWSSSSSSGESDSDVSFQEDDTEGGAAPEPVDPLTNLLQLHLPINALAGSRKREVTRSHIAHGKVGNAHNNNNNNNNNTSSSMVNPQDEVVRTSALAKLMHFHQEVRAPSWSI